MRERPQRAILIKVNPDGTIKERYRVLREDGFDPSGGYIEIKRQEDKDLVGNRIQDLLYREGRIQKKPVVRIRQNKAQIAADGKDEVEMTLEGVPDDLEELEIRIGGQRHKINPADPFYITMTHPQQLMVSIETRTVKSDPAFIRGIKKRARIEDAT